jgi:hypothetical protein
MSQSGFQRVTMTLLPLSRTLRTVKLRNRERHSHAAPPRDLRAQRALDLEIARVEPARSRTASLGSPSPRGAVRVDRSERHPAFGRAIASGGTHVADRRAAQPDRGVAGRPERRRPNGTQPLRSRRSLRTASRATVARRDRLQPTEYRVAIQQILRSLGEIPQLSDTSRELFRPRVPLFSQGVL